MVAPCAASVPRRASSRSSTTTWPPALRRAGPRARPRAPGGQPERHDVMLFNRMTAATLSTHLVLVRPGDTVIGVSPSYTHPTVVRSAALAGARFVDTVGAEAFATAFEREERVGLVVLTRLAVSYDAL